MKIIKGRFDGRTVVLEEPVPDGVVVNAPVKVVFEEQQPAEDSALEKIAKMARPGHLPPDFAEQHDHYVKQTPRR